MARGVLLAFLVLGLVACGGIDLPTREVSLVPTRCEQSMGRNFPQLFSKTEPLTSSKSQQGL